MGRNFKLLLLGMLFNLLVAGSALSLTVFSDNFNTENGGIGTDNYTSFSNWSVSQGSVDLVGGGYWDDLSLDGLSVDLDGSTRDAGKLSSVWFDVVESQTYTFSFDLAGNQRGGANDAFTIHVFISDFFDREFVVAPTDEWRTYTFDVTILAGTQAQIVFNHDGGDNVGALLDNVSFATAPVPEPATMLLFGVGLLGLAGVSRKKMN